MRLRVLTSRGIVGRQGGSDCGWNDVENNWPKQLKSAWWWTEEDVHTHAFLGSTETVINLQNILRKHSNLENSR